MMLRLNHLYLIYLFHYYSAKYEYAIQLTTPTK